MEKKTVTFKAIIDEKGLALSIKTSDDVTAAEVIGILEMAKVEVFKDNGNIADHESRVNI